MTTTRQLITAPAHSQYRPYRPPRRRASAWRSLMVFVALVGVLGGLGLLGGKWVASMADAAVNRLGSITGDGQAAAPVEAEPEPEPDPEPDPDAVPALDTVLLKRYDLAAAAAAAQGIELSITSGARSINEQKAEFEEAVGIYGSAEEAAKWVATPETSAHVRGAALDVGPQAGWEWLGQHQSEYGLCLVYANEPWHFEALTEPGEACPPLKADARG
ncbi:MAG: D-alanyl-D-alanine carboxypeptidase family protein [Bifidobacteriaceae bacterium]|jgi:hypothetical protein|nr:D-alanyl-D-alanine carboxypeptidase family protein [Bifidobacteriaceae bacterium]